VEQLLGRGGVADVFRAHDAATGHAVAVKLLRSDDDRSQARFRAEIEVLAQLDHPGVVRLLDAGWHEAHPYLVLDLVDGPTLATLLLDGPLGEERSVTIGGHLGAVLVYAHGLGIVHRDLKPSNVLFEDATQPPRLADFGLARLADSTRVTERGAATESTSRSTTTANPPSTTAAVQPVAATAPTTAPPRAAGPTPEAPPPTPAADRGRHGGPKPEPPKDHPEPQGPKKGVPHP
jgi:serine/threonine protein kinase